MGASEVLNAAADLLEKPGAWTTGVFARDASGKPARATDGNAACFCVAGAMERVTNSQSMFAGFGAAFEAMDTIAKRAGFRHIGAWNDAPGRTQSEVVAALRNAATQQGGEE